MSELDNVTRLKDLNYLSEQAAGAIAAQKILDTVPATVDGGLWRDGNALKMKAGAYAVTFDAISLTLIPTNLPITIDNNIVTVNGLQFQLTGFKTDLTAQNGLLFSDGSQCGVIAVNGSDYIFQMTFDALDVDNLQDGDTVSITALDEGSNLTLIFEESNFFSVGEQKTSKPFCSDTVDIDTECYTYIPAGKTNYVVQSDNNSYSFYAGDFKEFWIYFSDMFNGVDDFVDRITNTNLFNIEVTPDTTTEVANTYNVTITINEALFAGTFWGNYNSDAKITHANDFTCIFIPKDTNATYKYKYVVTDANGTSLLSVQEPATLGTATADNQNGGYKYTYKAAGFAKGYYANPSDQNFLYYRKADSDNNGFTITGLVEGLAVYGGTIYKQTDLTSITEDGTVNADKLASLTSYGTIEFDVLFNNDIVGKVILTNIDAIAKKTDGNGYCDVTLTDTLGDTSVFEVYFNGITISENKQYDDATFTLVESDTEHDRYKYVGPAVKEYFTRDSKDATSTAGKQSSFTYSPSAAADIQFEVDGLQTNLGSMSVVDGFITKGAITLGSVNGSAYNRT